MPNSLMWMLPFWRSTVARSTVASSTVAVALVSATFILPAPTVRASDALDLFPAASERAPVPSASDRVAAAFANLIEVDGVIRVESTTTRDGGETRTSQFRIYRKAFAPNILRTMIATPDPDSDQQEVRILEVIEGAAPPRSRVFVPRAGSEPVPTTYRITDPFLGTSSNKPPAEVRADLAGLMRRHEIVAREPSTLAGVAVDRITLRPVAARRQERVELAIAREAPIILEYRYFEGQDPRPARIVRTPRESLRELDGRLLPGVMIYEDRIDRTTTRLELRYEPLPSELGDSPFMESTFHRVRLPE